MQLIHPSINDLVTQIRGQPSIDNNPYIKPIVPETIKVPVPDGIDVRLIIHQNTESYQEITNYQVTKHKPFTEFRISTLYDQKRLVIFKEFLNLPSHYIEQILNEIFDDYEWTYINYDRLTVFVKYHGDRRDFDLDNVCTEVLYETVEDTKPCPMTVTSMKSHHKIMNIVKSANIDVKPDTNIDQNYQVDPNELIDVPKDMKYDIIQQLVKFRSQILRKEMENRKAKLKQDRLNSKKALSQTIKVDNIDVEPAVTYVEPEETNITDEEYRKSCEAKQQREQDRHFQLKLKQFNSAQIHKLSITKRLTMLRNYEQALVDDKLKFINNINLLVIDRSIRKQEEELDKINKQEFSSLEFVKDAPKLPVTKPQSSLETPNVISNGDNPIRSIFHLNDVNKTLINNKINDLVVKYLGIKDDDLTSYLINSIQDSSLSLEDIQETLDEDFVKFIEELNEFIDNLENNY